MKEANKTSLQSIFETIADPRVERTKRHQLLDIIILAILGVLCGAEGWVEIESFGKTKEIWLKTFLDLPNGIASHDTFGRVFARIDPKQFEECFLNWVRGLHEKISGVIAIDEKTLRRSHDAANGKKALQLESSGRLKLDAIALPRRPAHLPSIHRNAILSSMKLALKITPQRSTQYSTMVETLAAPELLASPLGQHIQSVTPTTLAGQAYLLATLDAEHLGENQAILSRLGAISEVYEYFERIGEVEGPLLRPIEPQFVPFVPVEMAEIRRYKGKTNEVFTQVLLNIALFAGAYSQKVMERLRILDPLAGGGTTLFLALAAGYDAFGIELGRQDIETTAVFVRQYLHGEHIPFKERDERRTIGHRYQFEIGQKKDTRLLVLAHGDAASANLHMQEVPGGQRMHAIVGDLPYGIQHFGEIASLLHKALPVWESMLLPGGTLALAWNATRIERTHIVNLLKEHTHLTVRDDPPYTQLAHTVDRVIKRRDILVAVRE